MRKTVYKAGKTIIREGEANKDAYIIVDGKVEITCQNHDGSVVVLGTLTENQMFGEFCLIDESLRGKTTIRALTDVVLAVVTPESFHDKISATPPAVKSILKLLAKRNCDYVDMIQDLYMQIDQRVAEKVDDIIFGNQQLRMELDDKNLKISELEEEIEKLKISGPAKKTNTSQKLEKDRSMKISLKNMDPFSQKDHNQ